MVEEFQGNLSSRTIPINDLSRQWISNSGEVQAAIKRVIASGSGRPPLFGPGEVTPVCGPATRGLSIYLRLSVLHALEPLDSMKQPFVETHKARRTV